MKRYKVGIIGATGMVGQRLITLLHNHPWFEISLLAASKSSAGKPYEEAVLGRWMMATPLPEPIKPMMVVDAAEKQRIADAVDFIFCAVSLPREETRALEEAFAKLGLPVISNNSACRMVDDVPMIIPEINADHARLIKAQKKRLGTDRGFIVVKPNCSIQSYVPALHPLLQHGPTRVVVCTYQAISGAGRTLETWPEMVDNVIPLIKGEEEKSEHEPMKIWGQVQSGRVVPAVSPEITAQCIRVPVSDGHLAAVFVDFERTPSRQQMIDAWNGYQGRPQQLRLPSAPQQPIRYFSEPDRPQTRLDRDLERGMAITVGRLRPDPVFDYKFVCLSHNTLRGAAGGAVLMAELLAAEGYLTAK
jgi:aspartate-semialdehyde dehydrogenase